MSALSDQSPPPTPAAAAGNSIQEFSTDLLRVYYGRASQDDSQFHVLFVLFWI